MRDLNYDLNWSSKPLETAVRIAANGVTHNYCYCVASFQEGVALAEPAQTG